MYVSDTLEYQLKWAIFLKFSLFFQGCTMGCKKAFFSIMMNIQKLKLSTLFLLRELLQH